MAKKSPSKTAARDTEAEVSQALSDEEHLELTIETLQPFLKPAAVVALVVVLGAVGLGVYRNFQRTNEMSAGKRLFAAQDIPGLQEVIDNFPSTTHAQIARLRQGRRHYSEGVFDQALEAYTDVANQAAGSEPFGPPAAIGRLYCLEALGRFEEAVEGFQTFVASHAGHYYELDAARGVARCLVQLGRLEEAREQYQAYLDAHPTHPSVAIVERQLVYIDRVAP